METMEMTTVAAAAGKLGYKLTKLGWIPEEWDITTLADIVDPERNITYGIVQAGPHVEDGVPYIKTGDLSAEIVPDTLSRTSHEIAQQYSRSEVYPGDIVFSLRGDVGASRIVPAELPVANLTQGTARIAIPGDSDRDFTFQQICSPDVAKRLLDQAKGSTFQEITLKALRLFTIVWPPERERIAIAEVLTSFDKATHNFSKLLIAKRTYKHGLMQQLLTGQRRFPKFQGQPWREQRISSLITESRIPGTNGKSAKKLTVKLYGKGVLAKNERLIGSENTKYYIRKAGQFIYSKLDFLNGAFGLISEELDGYESTLDLPAFDISPDADAFFLLSYFSREAFYARFADIAEGGRKAVRIGPEELLKKKILLPSLPEQQRIAAVLTACDQEIELLQAQLRQWQQQKKALMQQLLTGQLRVHKPL